MWFSFKVSSSQKQIFFVFFLSLVICYFLRGYNNPPLQQVAPLATTFVAYANIWLWFALLEIVILLKNPAVLCFGWLKPTWLQMRRLSISFTEIKVHVLYESLAATSPRL